MQQQEGNGLIGGGIGLGAGALGGYYLKEPIALPLARKMAGEMENSEWDKLSQADKANRSNRFFRYKDNIALLVQAGLPLAAALIGSTLTD